MTGIRRRTSAVVVAAVAAVTAWACALATPSASAAPFSCEASTVFVAQNNPTQLFTQRYGAGTTTFDPLGAPAGGFRYNGLGFNTADDYLYAIGFDAPVTGDLLQIDDDGSIRNLGGVTGLPGGMLTGTFGGGDYLVTNPYRDVLYAVDVRAQTATATRLTEPVGVFDWAYAGGYLWGTTGAEWVRVDPGTGQVTRLPATLPAASYGAAWRYGNGDLGFSNNTTGDVYRIRIAGPGSATPTFATVSVASGPATADNDGAACPGQPADLEIAKTGPAVTEPGATVTWTVTVRNNGPGTVSGFTVRDIVPGGVTSPATSTAGCDVVDGDVVCVLGVIAAGESRQIEVRARMPATTSTCVTNRAAVDSNGIDPLPGNDTASFESCTRDPLADVRIEKAADALSVLIGGTVRYTLTVVNDGPDPAQDVRVEDVSAAGVDPQSATPSQGACSSPSSCQLGALAAGATATIAVEATATALGAQGNTATVSSPTRDPDPSDNTSTTTVQVEPLADLSVVKRASDPRPVEGERFTYTIDVRNDGPSTARDVVVTDSLPSGVEVVSVRTSRGTCSHGPLVCDLGTMADGATAAIRVVVRVRDAGPLANSAVVTSSTPDPDPSDNHDSTTVEGVRLADLSIVKDASADSVIVGASIVYTLKVRNDGPSRALGVVVTDAVPAGLRLERVASSQGRCSGADVVVCEIGTLRPGQAETVRITATARRASAITNGASVTSRTPDPDPSDNTDRRTVDVGTEADLALRKTASVRTAPVGGTVVYGIVVTNSGPNSATDVTVADPLPAGARVVSARPSQGTCSVGAAVMTCAVGTIADGASAVIRLEVVFEQAGATRNVARVTSPTPDPDPTDNEDETEVTSEKADLAITKRASTRRPALGGALVYTVTVVNNGPDAARGVVVTDPVPDALRVRSATASAGSCAVADGVISCELGDMAPGATVAVTVEARAVRQGRVDNSASVVARFPSDPDGSDNTAEAAVKVRPGRTRLRVGKRASRTHVAAGDRVRYRVVVRNAGRRTAYRVRVCDRLPRGMAFVRRGGARLRRGQACWAVRSLAPGERRVFRVTARVLGGRAARLVNVAAAKGRNTRAARDRAAVRRAAQQVQAGGVTG